MSDTARDGKPAPDETLKSSHDGSAMPSLDESGQPSLPEPANPSPHAPTAAPPQTASCIVGDDSDALSVAQAQAVIARCVPRLGTDRQAVEHLALRSALGRVLALDVTSPIDVPAHDNAAMDGYALRGAELRPGAPTRLALAGAAQAGHTFDGPVPPGHCVRITTGAVLPAGLDTVVPREFTALDGDRIVLAADAVAPGDHRRRAGEDLARGEVALAAGRLLRPADIGLLASLGRAEVAVQRRLRVAFFSTGDELRSIGEPLPAGCVYDSNRYTLHAMLTRLNVDVLDLGVVRDDPAALEAAFRTACEHADAVITSGGVSVGEADHTKQVMARLGDVAFWHIAMRPGRPMAFGRIGGGGGGVGDGRDGRDGNGGAGRGDGSNGSRTGSGAVLFGLPGNPVAVMVCFYAFVRDALLAMAGTADTSTAQLPLLRARALAPMRKKPGRTEYQRAIVRRAADGDWDVALTGSQGSGVLRSMSQANGLVVLGHAQGPVERGAYVDVLPFDGLL